jgi:hypothetical protein
MSEEFALRMNNTSKIKTAEETILFINMLQTRHINKNKMKKISDLFGLTYDY